MTAPLTDLEITKACAIAMGIVIGEMEPGRLRSIDQRSGEGVVVWGKRDYDPLRDDAQAMALVKRFWLWMSKHAGEENWRVAATLRDHVQNHTADPDLNRAICLCIAAMTAPKD